MNAKTGNIISKKNSGQHVECNSCAYFFITWNKDFPYGCRAMRFMSSNSPSRDVLEVEGRECLAYMDKHSHANEQENLKSKMDGGKGQERQVNVVV